MILWLCSKEALIPNFQKICEQASNKHRSNMKKTIFTMTDLYQLLNGEFSLQNSSERISKQNFCKTWWNHGQKAKQLTFTPGLTKWWDSSKMMVEDDRWWVRVMILVFHVHLFTTANANSNQAKPTARLLFITVTEDLTWCDDNQIQKFHCKNNVCINFVTV